ncbi:MAG: hypothetical protein E6H57_12830 [Betaproteobacteria bacterium]|nr:MAG: hypothetical protein E6H57_12830 [Betaproteobacteria bacterium]
MTNPIERGTPWPGGVDVVFFCGSIILFLYVGIIGLGTLSELLSFSKLPTEQTMFRYGGTAVLIWLLFVGTISFLIGGFFARRLRRMRARWLSAVVGGIYSVVVVALSMFVQMQPRSLGGIALVVFLFLFPAVGLVIGASKLKRSNLSLQPDRPQAGGG